MRIAEARRAPRHRTPVATAHPQTSRPETFQAPSEGLVTNSNVAVDLPGAALVLDNWVATERGARVRGGSTNTGLVTGLADIVETFTYKSGTVELMFAATETEIFDMTSPPLPPSTVANDITGLTSGDWYAMQQTTPGGTFLIIANGADAVRNHDGSVWTTPAITGVTPADLNFCWLFGNRGFYIENNSMDAWYLPVDSIAGGAVAFPLGGQFRKGGNLLAGFDWGIESGDGLSDLCCFLTTEGEVAVYAGSDPATDFVLKGVYSIGKPLGKHAIMKAGGDILIATTQGLVPMSQAFTRDQAAMRSIAVSRQIEDQWGSEASIRGNDWKIDIWKEAGYAVVSLPEVSGLPDRIFVVSLLTGKWSTISGWNARSWAVLAGQLYFGSTDGKIIAAEVGGGDDGVPYIVSYLGTFKSLGDSGVVRSAKLATAEFDANFDLNVKLFVRTDYDTSLPTPPAVSESTLDSDGWDVGKWDEALWDSGASRSHQRIRQSVTGTGNAMAVGTMMTIDGTVKVLAELLVTKVQIEQGESVI